LVIGSGRLLPGTTGRSGRGAGLTRGSVMVGRGGCGAAGLGTAAGAGVFVVAVAAGRGLTSGLGSGGSFPSMMSLTVFTASGSTVLM